MNAVADDGCWRNQNEGCGVQQISPRLLEYLSLQ